MLYKPWIKHYPSGVPTEIKASEETLTLMLKKSAQKFPNNIALSCQGQDITYQQVDKYSNKVAAFLHYELGFKQGDKIAIMLPNFLQFPIVLISILKIGASFISVNPLYTKHELQEIMKDSGATGIFILSTFAHLAQEAKKNLPHLKHMISTDFVDLYSSPKKQIIHFVATYIKGIKSKYDEKQFHKLHTALHYNRNFNEKSVTISCDDVACLQYSSGTTGKPKGIILLHRNIVANIHQVWQWMGSNINLDKQILIGALPLYHIFALTANFFTFYLAGSKQVLIPNPRDISSLVKTMQKTPFTIFNSINTLYTALLHNKNFRKSTFPHFKYTLSGGMSTVKRVADDWKAVTGVTIHEAYGLSEMSPAVTINRFDDNIFTGTVGYPLPSTEVSIRDNQGNVLPANEHGEIWVKGPQQSPGFWHLEKITKDHFTHDGWLKTGDIGLFDTKGRLRISGRSKNMLIISGFNVFPKEIENTILQLPEVKEVAVVGAPSPSSGEKPFAFVVLEENKLITAKNITEFCYTKLTQYKIPKDIMFLNELPKNSVGKVLKQELKKQCMLTVNKSE